MPRDPRTTDERLIAYLASCPGFVATVREIRRRNKRREDLAAVIRLLRHYGIIAKFGTGKKPNPYSFRLSDIEFESLAEARAIIEQRYQKARLQKFMRKDPNAMKPTKQCILDFLIKSPAYTAPRREVFKRFKYRKDFFAMYAALLVSGLIIEYGEGTRNGERRLAIADISRVLAPASPVSLDSSGQSDPAREQIDQTAHAAPETAPETAPQTDPNEDTIF